MQNLIENLKYQFMQNSKLKYYVIAGVIAFISLIIVLVLCFSTNEEEIPEIVEENIEDYIEEEVIEEEVKEVPQEETINLLKVFITDKRNLSYKYIYEVLVGSGNTETKSLVTADKNTIFLDLNTKTITNPEDVSIGDTVILYATGKYTASNLLASVICKGSDTSYRHGILTNLDGTIDNCTVKLANTGDVLLLNTSTTIINGLTGGEILGLAEISQNTKILYKYNPDFTITESGNIYTCNEVILLGGDGR